MTTALSPNEPWFHALTHTCPRRADAASGPLVRRLSDRKLFLYDRLVVPGTDAWLNLKWFSSRAVRQACLERRWPVDRTS